MELLQLKYFCMLAKNQHLTETAKELMISPPSLSLTIKKLEQEVGVSLFDRVGRDIRLNSSGEIFYHYIERGLIFIEEGIYKAQKYHGGGKSQITICFGNPLLWLELVETFKQIYPSISAETHVITNRETIKKMHYDFYLGNYNDLEETDVQYKKLMEPEKQFLIMNHKNPLSNKKMLDLEDLENEVFFSFSPEVDMAKHEVTEDLAKRLPYKMKLIEGDNLLRYKLLRENKCIALTTDVGMRVHYPSMEGLIAVPITGRIFPKTRMQVIAWPKQNKFSDAGRQFYEFVITSMLKKQEEAS